MSNLMDNMTPEEREAARDRARDLNVMIGRVNVMIWTLEEARKAIRSGDTYFAFDRFNSVGDQLEYFGRSVRPFEEG